MYVRWRPSSAHSPKRFWKFCITRCSMLGEIAATSSLMFCFKSTVVLGFFSYTFALEISSEEAVLRLGTLVPMNIECRRNILWVKTESLFLKYISTATARCSTDQPALHGNWNASLVGRSRTNSPRQRFHSQLFCKIVRYFCRTLYAFFLRPILILIDLIIKDKLRKNEFVPLR